MAQILIGIPTTRQDERFLASFDSFEKEISKQHVVATMWQHNLRLVDAQNNIAEAFMAANFDYLLFLDDDQWGHTPEMLECLIHANSHMATMKTYSRHYPYSCALMRRHDNSYAGIENAIGYRSCDLTGFPMTLLSRSLFNILDRPFFRESDDALRDWTTDREFCERLDRIGIKPMGCFQHCLSHGDITEENVYRRRESERMNDNNMGMYILHRKRSMACTDRL